MSHKSILFGLVLLGSTSLAPFTVQWLHPALFKGHSAQK